MKHFVIGLLGIIFGIIVGYGVIYGTPFFLKERKANYISPLITSFKPQVVGFLPYWLLGKVNDSYADTITTLTYFGLTIGEDGKIVKLVNEQEEEPGWSALSSEKLQTVMDSTKKQSISQSLLVFSGEREAINALMSDPVVHGKNLVSDVMPIMKKYEFTDLNIDIESTSIASPAARKNFVRFIKTVREGLDENHIESLSVEISGNDVIFPYLINTPAIEPYVDHIILMAYDFHYSGSSVTGAVAPLFGAGKISEYDTQAAIEKLLESIPAQKITLGIPSYGYEWETLDSIPHAAIIPGTGITASSERAQEVLKNCASCSAQFDDDAKEAYLIYPDDITGTYHQLFFPTDVSTKEKVSYARTVGLGGLAVWALGYEDRTILQPLEQYIR